MISHSLLCLYRQRSISKSSTFDLMKQKMTHFSPFLSLRQPLLFLCNRNPYRSVASIHTKGLFKRKLLPRCYLIILFPAYDFVLLQFILKYFYVIGFMGGGWGRVSSCFMNGGVEDRIFPLRFSYLTGCCDWQTESELYHEFIH